MNVYFPFERPGNNFLDEIENYFKGTFIFDTNQVIEKKKIDIINIHWPEAFFKWEEPTVVQLNELRQKILSWKKKYPIVYTRHNIYPHNKKAKNLIKLYDFIAANADVVIHLGMFSMKDFKIRYPNNNCIHTCVEHPLYLLKKNDITKKEAREFFGISEKSKVLLSFGALRNKKEFKLLFGAFQKIKLKNKKLFISRKPGFRFEIPFLIRSYTLNGYYDRLYKKIMGTIYNIVFYDASFIDQDEVQKYLLLADTLVIARMDQLNSGDLFLGLTFKKKIVVPKFGNLIEILEGLDVFSYIPGNEVSLQKAMSQSLTKEFTDNRNQDYMNRWHPKKISDETYSVFKKAVNIRKNG